MPSQDNYRIQLESFEGPLDLLLFLIRRAEVDITDIPVAVIADDYLRILKQASAVDVDAAAEFLVMAATLVELKSRTLMPAEVREAVDRENAGGDPRSELIQQLLDYQRVRLAAEELDGCKAQAERRLEVRIREGTQEATEETPELDLEDVHAMDLAEAYERLSSIIDFDRLGEHIVAIDDTPILLHQADLVDRLQRRQGTVVNLLEIFDGCSPGQRVGLFLATLELVRRGQVRVNQEGEGPILLELRDDAESFEYDEVDDTGSTPEDVPISEDAEVPCDPDHATDPDEVPSVSVDRSTDA
jgi:segregation and condensation protein A